MSGTGPVLRSTVLIYVHPIPTNVVNNLLETQPTLGFMFHLPRSIAVVLPPTSLANRSI
jgi:hypothetical protein